ncbi:MAG: D-hexose-6-phosphate mutarotase [Cellvibrionaceae bacterium]|nr:D-hexose-6-phosphate mutarotase [Cellvibrionaceae bacterium]
MKLATRRDGDIEIHRVKNPYCEAEFTVFGGHIMQWQPEQQKPVLWQSKNAAMNGSTAIRGGIPLCWPWFGEIPERGKHGLVRTALWTLDTVEQLSDGTCVKLFLEIPDTVNPWGYPSRCEQVIHFGASLKQTLTISNNASDSQYSFAFHNYFAIGALEHVELPFTRHVDYHDKILQCDIAAHDKPIEFDTPIDRIYHSAEDALLLDHKWRRRIHIKKSHCPSTVVWNPAGDAKNIKDIHAGGEQEYVCVESAAASPVKIAANAVNTHSQTIVVESF